MNIKTSFNPKFILLRFLIVSKMFPQDLYLLYLKTNISMIDPNLIISLIIDGIIVGSIYALVSTGLNLISGVMNIINFAQGEFLMLGMYLSLFSLTMFNIPLLLSLPLSFLVMFLIGCFIMKYMFSWFLKRGISGESLLLITYAMSLIISISAQYAFGVEYRMAPAPFGRYPFQLGPISVSAEGWASFILAIIISILLYIFLSKTKLGKAIRATAQDPEAAMVLGINVNFTRTINMGLGIALAGVAGSILTFTYYIHPAIGGSYIFKAITICVLGGWGNVVGALVGAFILGVVESISLIFISVNFKEVVTFIVFILILMLRPQGLFRRAT